MGKQNISGISCIYSIPICRTIFLCSFFFAHKVMTAIECLACTNWQSSDPKLKLRSLRQANREKGVPRDHYLLISLALPSFVRIAE